MSNVQLIAITKADGSLAVMQFVTHQERHGADPGWYREATPENVEAEIAKAGLACVRWRLIQPKDLPVSREHRAYWRDTGSAIVVEAP
jgi:hypothetical protein